MIIIDKPFIETIGDKTYLKSYIIDEFTGTHDFCYYFTGTKYGNYFTCEVADAFVLALLLPALQSNQSILVKAPISEKLYYNLKNTIIFLLAKAFKYKEIEILVTETVVLDAKSNGVGTGCSLGVDSFATILSHTTPDCPKSYKLTHLTFFNVGSHGEENLDEVREAYLKDLKEIQIFADEINLPLISLESNLVTFYSKYDLNFNQTHVIRGMSMVLSLQKLFKKYIYSSGYPVSEIHLSSIDPTYMEGVLLPNLSTENTTLIVGGPNQSRTEKMTQISDSPLAMKYLYVCCKDIVINNNMNIAPWVNLNNDSEKKNCSGCDKCLRTLVGLDAINKINNYENLFDLEKYGKLKTLFIAKTIGMRKRSFVYLDIYNLLKKEKFKIPFISKLLSITYRIKIDVLLYKIFNKKG